MQTNPAPKSKSPFGQILLVLVLMALSSLATYLIMKNTEVAQKDEIIVSKNNEIDDLTKKMRDVSKQLDEKIAESKKLGADYKTLQAYKEQLESDIAALKQNSELSQVQIRQYGQKIQAYQTMLAAKDKELAELKEKNAQLTEEKDSLLVTSDSLKGTTQALTGTLKEVNESNRKLTDAAATLRAENIAIAAYNSREKQESRNTFRAKRIDKLMVDFSIARNAIAQAGNKEVFMRIVEPSGTVIYNQQAGSGKFDFEGSETSFTTKKNVAYTNQATTVKMAFDKPKDYDFNAGKYQVELYCEGKQIGFKSFEVK
ncbi:MAG: hypothetical protein MUE85_23925 [Microscillaceae bacterium]|jgi:hypothetical protein|nr:hypothetical protein [Microscillaceae bacterium]